MAKFSFIAVNKEGEKKEGEMEGIDEQSVAVQLRAEGFFPTFLEEKKEGNKGFNLKKFSDGFLSVSLKSKMIFCRHLAVMISSGLSVSRALAILAEQEENKGFKKAINQLVADVKKGLALADAMANYPKIFNQVFVSMIRVGELGGQLEEILRILADQLEKDHKLVSKVRGALIYPAVIICVMFVIGILMMIFVLPKITSLFDDFGAELPIMTRIIIATSKFVSNHAFTTIGGIIAFVVGLFYFSRTKLGTKIFHKVFIKAPIIGGITIKVNSARFARILSSLLQSGVSLVESLRITSDTLKNYYFKKTCLAASEQVQKGINLSQILEDGERVFPYLVVQMIQVGEETGKTPEILIRLASFYEEEVDQITKNMSSIIEPILMVLIGAAVGIFAIGIIQPIYSIMEKV